MKKKLKNWSKTESEIFSVCNDVLMYSRRVMVPLSLQKLILRKFHTGHPDISRMKSLMISCVYWCCMDRDIGSLVKSCKDCALAVKTLPIKFNSWPEINCTWSCLHIDFTGPLNNSYYLIIVDSFSKWLEIL